jgi:uncharacterized membrane protein
MAKALHKLVVLSGGVVLIIAMLAVLPANAASASAPRGYVAGKFVPIGVPGYTTSTIPSGVNDLGVVSGSYTDGSGRTHGFIERAGKYTTIDVPVAALGDSVSGVTDFGQIVGGYTTPDNVNHGYIDRFGHFTTIDDPHATNTAGYGTIVQAVSGLGKIFGYYYDSALTVHGFMYDNGHFVTLDCPQAGTGPGDPDPYGIGNYGTIIVQGNDFGAAVGGCLEQNATDYAFVYTPDGNFHPMPSAPGSQHMGISWVTDSGVIGGVYQDTQGVWNGYVYQGHRFTEIPAPSGASALIFNGANNLEVTVGFVADSSGLHGFELFPAK